MEQALGGSDGLVITDRNVADAWPTVLRDSIQISPGESAKALEPYGGLLRTLAQRKVQRSDRLVAVGGGVIGDLVGFVAASYMRGIRYTQVPTTLLAMVDSSVGGKVGIDLPEGKNLVGAFWPPSAVLVPLDALRTLSDRHFRNGMAEVWKYAFILEPGLCDKLARAPLTFASTELETIIARCITLKAGIVQDDEHDLKGRRAILNFGHTVGHAIEKETGYASVLHGEAIAIGMVAEAKLGEALGITPRGTSDRISRYLSADGLPVAFPNLAGPRMIEAMRLDKKVEGDGLAFSLLTDMGRCKLVTGVAESDVEAILK
jgi:3-dehydroquinate synthase